VKNTSRRQDKSFRAVESVKLTQKLWAEGELGTIFRSRSLPYILFISSDENDRGQHLKPVVLFSGLPVYFPLCVLREQWEPPLWSSGQRSWQPIQGPGFDSQSYQIF
jgi:hypothetical protein